MKPLITVILICVISSAQSEETTLTLVSSWNRQQNFTALFMKYVQTVNEIGKGIVQIDFRGGPEVMPQRQLLYALRRGVIDMAFGGITYYRGVLPEGDAIFASTITPMEARANGALDALQPYWGKRINSHLIGWMQSGIGINIYLSEAPEFRADGMPDLAGLKIRTSPSNREILTTLGGRAVQIAVKEIFTSLQRGTVDGLAFTTTGLPDLGIQRFIRYRIDPAFLQLAICLQINLDTDSGLPSMASNLVAPLTTAFITYQVAQFGQEAVAGFGVASRIEGLTLIALMALSAAVTPFVGQNFGAEKYDRVRDGVSWAFRFAFFYGLAIAAFLALSSNFIVSLFTDDPKAVATANLHMRIVPLSYFGLGMAMTVNSTFNAIGKPLPGMFVSLTRTIMVYAPLAFLLAHLFGLIGVFAAAFTANLIAGGVGTIWLRSVLDRVIKEDRAVMHG